MQVKEYKRRIFAFYAHYFCQINKPPDLVALKLYKCKAVFLCKYTKYTRCVFLFKKRLDKIRNACYNIIKEKENRAKAQRQKGKVITMMNTIIAKIQNIINNSADCYNYEIRTNTWEKGDKSRTYIAVIETADRTRHYRKHEFGYIDNITNEYVPGKWDANQRFTLGGSKF